MNIVVAVGRLGADPEMRYTATGTPVTNFSVATSRRFNDAQGDLKEETTWFRCVAWAGQAEFAGNYLKKGHMVAVHGRLQNRTVPATEDQPVRYFTELVVERLEQLNTKAEADAINERNAKSTGEDEPSEQEPTQTTRLEAAVS